ncbi:hypothetical protein ANN_19256 [Periplaneta americana]|uniref:Uncharacterized protein n=1 Tax=Periplaneta americana TaxID=6978 RepID=A0ABQ8S9V0_PERAM|nr:hypothetical protein ANN_19256 [Periplaneta americana]
MERPTPELNLSMDVKKNSESTHAISLQHHMENKNWLFGGHNESVESDNIGNYIEYLSSLSEFDHLLANHLESSTVFRGTYLAIQNDLIFAIIGVMIKNIKPFVAIVVDETSYCSNQSQLSTVLRYVDSTANVQERFIGFTNVSSTKLLLLVSALKEYREKRTAFFKNIICNDSEENWDDAVNVQAQGYLNFFTQFQNIFLLEVYARVFAHTDVLYNILQTKSLDIAYYLQEVSKLKKNTISEFRRSGFPSIWSNMENENSSANTMEPPLKRRQGDDELKYRQLYYSILDRMHMEITDRFSDYGKLQFTHLLDSQKFSAYRENFPNEALNKLFQSYNSHFDQLNTPSLALPVPLQRKTESAVDMLAFPHRKRDLLMFLENIALELLNHKGQTKVLRSRIREELQEVVDLAYTLQGVSHFERWLNLPKYKAIPIRSLNNTNGKIDWLEFLQTVFGKTDLKLTSKQLVYIPDGKLIYNILQIFNTTDSRVLANYVVSCIVMYLAPETTERMHSFLMHLYHKLEIIPKEHPRWQYCVHKVRDYPDMGLGPAIAYAYMNDHFDRNNVLRMSERKRFRRDRLGRQNRMEEENKSDINFGHKATYLHCVPDLLRMDTTKNLNESTNEENINERKRLEIKKRLSGIVNKSARNRKGKVAEDMRLQWKDAGEIINVRKSRSGDTVLASSGRRPAMTSPQGQVRSAKLQKNGEISRVSDGNRSG